MKELAYDLSVENSVFEQNSAKNYVILLHAGVILYLFFCVFQESQEQSKLFYAKSNAELLKNPHKIFI